MVFFYIDPGTGSMLFTILIGVLGAAFYLLRNVFVKLRFLFSGGRAKGDENRVPFAIFTDNKRYWSIFKPICDAFERRQKPLVYMTASPDDPLLEEKYQYVRAEFIGEGNKAFARMNLLKADVVLSSTPSIDVYQWKRSRDVRWYAHILHAANDMTEYRMFGLDYYDAVMVSGEYQRGQIRQMEALRGLPEKELPMIGLPHMDSLREKLLAAGGAPEHPPTVLLAPSWGPSNIFHRYGGRLIDALLRTDYHIIIRPHPQSFTSEKEVLDDLMQRYPASERLEWDSSNDNFETLRRSDILISDYSGVIFVFSLVFDKPIIYADTSFDKGPYDAWWTDEEMWTFRTLPRLGMQLTEANCDDIGALVERCIHSEAFREGREAARREAWANIGESVERAVDYLIDKQAALAGAGEAAAAKPSAAPSAAAE